METKGRWLYAGQKVLPSVGMQPGRIHNLTMVERVSLPVTTPVALHCPRHEEGKGHFQWPMPSLCDTHLFQCLPLKEKNPSA